MGLFPIWTEPLAQLTGYSLSEVLPLVDLYFCGNSSLVIANASLSSCDNETPDSGVASDIEVSNTDSVDSDRSFGITPKRKQVSYNSDTTKRRKN
ncbi:hypothetical protein QYM36_016118 [Artemia franciscana]|uniref:Uncharacterized protein n=2 Tax=Artemia franciscana TaxID=6661 RepID=A0AA88KXU9_ARTSF|nr:hypothetical protein QYM36_016118 [Artemia franciscana]